MATIMTTEPFLYYFKGDVISDKEINDIKDNSIWSMWDPLFVYYQVVFDDEEAALVFRLKHSDTIAEHRQLTQAEWDNRRSNQKEETPERKDMLQSLRDLIIGTNIIKEVVQNARKKFSKR